MKTLVIASRQWSTYADAFAAGLGPDWRVSCCGESGEPLQAALDGADALLALEVPPEALPASIGLKVFLYPGAGLIRQNPGDYPSGCAVVTVGEHGSAIAEYVMAAVLMHVTAVAEHAAQLRAGSWAGSGRTGGIPHEEACGKTLGIVGFGEIGQAVAVRARAFGMRVLAIRSRPPQAEGECPCRVDFLGGPADLPRLLAESDFLVIACPLTPHTRGMLGARQLAAMKPLAYLINVARAEIVDEAALFAALGEGRLAGAALDVWYRYPEHGEQILHGSALPFHELPHVLVTPHMAAWTRPLINRRIARMVETLRQYEVGAPLDRVAFVGTWAPQPPGGVR